MTWLRFRWSGRTAKILIALVLIFLIFFGDVQIWNISSVTRQPDPKYYALDGTSFQLSKGEEVLGWDSCQVPDIDPHDARVRQFIENFPRLPCIAPQPKLVTLYPGGDLVYNRDVIRSQRLGQVHCVYREVYRKDGTDDDVIYTEEKRFSHAVAVKSDIVYIRCETGGLLGKVHYENLLPVFRKKDDVVKRRRHQKPSVLFLVIDSLSRLNSLRLLPSMHKFLRKQLKAHVFSLHVKCGMNTRPNMAAMLTGKRVYYWDVGGKKLKPELTSTKPNSTETVFIDDWPLIWKDYAAKGYTTFYGEDLFDIAMFNYLEKGFKNPPTHHYLRPYFLAWSKLNNEGIFHRKHIKYCFMDKPVYDVLLDWGRDVQQMYLGSPTFGLNVISYSHDYLSQFQQLDSPMARTLESLYYGKMLNDTILFVMGDHGLRMGDFRKTWMGRLEDNMPLFSVVLPEWMKKKYPHLEENLEYNTGKLTTWYDVHATLQDILHEDFEFSSEFHDRGGKGLSLFKKIKVNRTCEEAGIPLSYCPCMAETKLRIGDAVAEEAAQEVVNEINRLLKGTGGKCAKISLMKINEAVSLQMEVDHISKGRKVPVGIRIVLELAPSSALVETVLTYDPHSDKYVVKETIERINRFGNQGKCVQDRLLERYCYCI